MTAALAWGRGVRWRAFVGASGVWAPRCLLPLRALEREVLTPKEWARWRELGGGR